ncbi:SseB family protein [Micromonospora krabiensis]|uniref:SseB family protein n=1 Tax=Micromonospora krabiensis TaxID=307121 RepID=UPI0012FE4975|nr:SseB family protein [Micromonospora krabiensis]
MTEWEPATEAEAAMRDALRANDQELYFRILARTDLLLPVSAQSAGPAAAGWGTWTTGGRTHVLAFTSSAALRACLGDNAGPTRRTPYAELAGGWPNPEWWLAVNPGLPVEGYLPAWFVTQLSRGDVRLPGRTLGARARLERAETLARARAAGGGRDASSGPSAGAGDVPSAGPQPGAAVHTVPASSGNGSSSSAESVLPRRPVDPPPDARQPSTGRGLLDSARRLAEPSRLDSTRPAAERGRLDSAHPAEPGRLDNVRPAAEPSRLVSGRSAPPPFMPSANDRPGAGSRWPAPPRPGAGSDSERTGGSGRDAGTADGPGRRDEPATRADGDGAEPRRSFFEPASGRRSAPLGDPAAGRRSAPLGDSARPADRAVPPSRFARGEQPFPRRRPFHGPVGAEPTHAFLAPDREPTPAPRAPVNDPPAGRRPEVEATQPLPRPEPSAEDVTRAFRASVGPHRSAGRPSWAGTDEDRTQPLPPRHPEPVEELARSVAEPVSAPPAPRQDFKPIVIEGTIIASRDLPDDPEDEPRSPAPGRRWASDRPDGEASATRSGDRSSTAGNGRTEGDNDLWGVRQAGGAAAASGDGADLWTPRAGRGATSGAGTSAGAADATMRFAAAGAADPTTAYTETGSTDPTAGLGASEPARPSTGYADAASTGAAGYADAASTGADATADPRGGGSAPPRPADEPIAESADTTPAVAEPPVDFQPANAVEEDLLSAAGAGSTDTFLSTLLLARVLLPVAPDSTPGSRPGDTGFVWRTQELDGETFVVVYTSPERLADHADGEVETVRVKFVQLIRRWPDEAWSFAVNPGSPVGAKLPGEQIVALASWAAEVGLGDEGEIEEAPAPAERPRHTPKAVDPSRPVLMQKAVAPSQLTYYLERGYDRVSGFVHRANELAHLTTPAELYDALGLGYPDSPFSRDAEEIYVLRWPAHRPSLYRIPYGGQNEAAMRAMEGWVIERAPFRGNGFAPGESSDVVAEFKVDSARLPHGARLLRLGADGSERVVAVLDTDTVSWREVGAE